MLLLFRDLEVVCNACSHQVHKLIAYYGVYSHTVAASGSEEDKVAFCIVSSVVFCFQIKQGICNYL